MGEHDNHRVRVRDKVIKIGFEGFGEHEVIEFLLFYGIPRKNTNDIAHALLKKFGTLSQVLEASIEDLFSVTGMTRNAAILLHSLPKLFSVYKNNRFDRKGQILSANDILPYLRGALECNNEEHLLIICLNSKQRIINCVEIGEGGLDNISFKPRSIAEVALRHNAVGVIVAHNHPSGTATPSNEDISFTIELKALLESLDVTLVDHIIISEEAAHSFFLSRELGLEVKTDSYPRLRNEYAPPEQNTVMIMRENEKFIRRPRR